MNVPSVLAVSLLPCSFVHVLYNALARQLCFILEARIIHAKKDKNDTVKLEKTVLKRELLSVLS